MGNFIDKTFTVIADILLKVLPASKQEKQAFSYYRAGMSAQGKGRYAEALQNYYEALFSYLQYLLTKQFQLIFYCGVLRQLLFICLFAEFFGFF